ncbi:MAG: hypothetical protein JSW63_03415 [Ignavibacterium sp.]|nr:MAG: hypothetical protein JSW63_03415 [Ignavibacterium sp.]
MITKNKRLNMVLIHFSKWRGSCPLSSVIFDDLGNDGEAFRIGIYIIFLEAINEGAGVVENLKIVVVVCLL